MRFQLLAATAATLLALPAAAVSFTSTPGAPDPGMPAGHTMVVTFDAPEAVGYSWADGLSTATGTSPGVYAAPAGNATVFGYVSSAITPNNATLSTPKLKEISFYWGSIDTYNMVEVLGSSGVLFTVMGGDFSAADGNQLVPGTNRRVTFAWDGANAITGLRMTSTGVAFEFDDFSAIAVPEPATWAMLIAGFGMVGWASRRRRAADVARVQA